MRSPSLTAADKPDNGPQRAVRRTKYGDAAYGALALCQGAPRQGEDV